MSQLPDVVTEKPDAVNPKKKLSVFQDTAAPEQSCKGPSPAEQTPFTAGLATEMKSLRARFTYNGEERRSSEDSNADTVTMSSPSKDSKRKRSVASEQPVIPCSSPVADRAVESSRKSTGLEAAADEINEADWLAAESQPLSGCSGTNTQSSRDTQSSGASKPCFSQGSEDLLVPDSDGEEEIDEVEDRDSHRTSFSFDLARFAFVG